MERTDGYVTTLRIPMPIYVVERCGGIGVVSSGYHSPTLGLCTHAKSCTVTQNIARVNMP